MTVYQPSFEWTPLCIYDIRYTGRLCRSLLTLLSIELAGLTFTRLVYHVCHPPGSDHLWGQPQPQSFDVR